jgi:hypothetical protein
MANISAISFHARKGFVAAGVSTKLSHVQELAAAALGHNTLASYQVASEDVALAGATHVVLDPLLLEERAAKLGLSVPVTQLVDVVSAAVKTAFPAVRLHQSVEDFGDVLHAELEIEAETDDNVASEMASCNHAGVSEVYMPVDPTEFTELAQVGRVYAAKTKGMITMHIDPERPYSGHQIRVDAVLSMERLGRRCFDAPSVEITFATVLGDEPEAVSLAQTLADFTGLDIATAEALTEVDPNTESSEDGLAYNYIYNCKDHLQPDAEAAVQARYPDLVVMVSAWVVDNASAL